MQHKRDFLLENGYVVFPGFLTSAASAAYKNRAIDALLQEDGHTLKPSTFRNMDEIGRIPFSTEVSSLLQELTQAPVTCYPNTTIRRDLYINWHCDDAFLGDFVIEKERSLPEFLQCNIYLQPNSIEVGGGIDVCLGSQHLSHEDKRKKIAAGIDDFETVMTQAGDLLLFDYRVIHRSTQPKQPDNLAPRVAIQWTTSRSNQYAPMILAYFNKRRNEKLHLSDFTKQRALAYFNDMFELQYPESFPQDICDLIVKNRITMVENYAA